MEKNISNDITLPKKGKSWHPQQEKILKRWSEQGSSYRYLHDKSFNKYERCNMCFSLPVIILSTLTGVANFAQSSFPVDARPMVSVVVGSLNIIAGLITTIAQFLKVAEKMEGHRAASVAYSKFSRNISVELSLPVKERLVDGTEFLSNQRSELDRLIEQSPNIPEDIVKHFDKVFIKRDATGNKVEDDTTFYKPEILDIRPVQIYEKTKAEQDEEDKINKINEMKWNKEIKDLIIKDDDKRRDEIYNDVIKQMNTAQQQINTTVEVPDASEPKSIEIEMNNIMQELNMNELNDMGFDIETNTFVENKTDSNDVICKPVEDVAEEDSSQPEVTINIDISNNNIPTDDISNDDTSNNDTSNNDTSNNDTSNNDTSNNDTSNSDMSDNDMSDNVIIERINIE